MSVCGGRPKRSAAGENDSVPRFQDTKRDTGLSNHADKACKYRSLRGHSKITFSHEEKEGSHPNASLFTTLSRMIVPSNALRIFRAVCWHIRSLASRVTPAR